MICIIELTPNTDRTFMHSDIYIITVLIATYLNRKHENIVPYMVSKPSRAIDYDSGWLTRCEVFALLGMF